VNNREIERNIERKRETEREINVIHERKRGLEKHCEKVRCNE